MTRKPLMAALGASVLTSAFIAAVPLAASGSKTTTGTAASGKPVPGGFYEYQKVFAKDPLPGFDLPGPKRNVATIRVSREGTSLTVVWGLVVGAGCVGRSYGGKVEKEPGGDVIEQVAITPSGTFHGIRTRKASRYIRYWRSEASGAFASDGRYVDLRVREKLYSKKDSSNWHRCDGRWLRFRVPLRRSSSSSAPAPKPTPPVYEPGRYKGTVVYGVVYDSLTVAKGLKGPLSFTVVRDASGRGTVRDVQFQVQIGWCATLKDRQGEVVTERLTEELPIHVNQFDTLVDEPGHRIDFHGRLKGRTAGGTLGVNWGRCLTHDGLANNGPIPWSASKVSP